MRTYKTKSISVPPTLAERVDEVLALPVCKENGVTWSRLCCCLLYEYVTELEKAMDRQLIENQEGTDNA